MAMVGGALKDKNSSKWIKNTRDRLRGMLQSNFLDCALLDNI